VEVVDLEHSRTLRLPPPHERSQPGQQLREREWLDEVVVGARVEPRDPVAHRVAGGEHQHGHPDTRGAEPPAGLKPVDPGQHHVQHDRVVGMRTGRDERLLAAWSNVRGEPLGDKPAPNQACHP